MKNKSKKSNKYIAEFNYISEKKILDLDVRLSNELKVGEDDEIVSINNSDNFTWSGESHPINIDSLIELLNQIKENGCKYVEIMYHIDHIGYYIYGMNIKKYSSDDDKGKILLENKRKEIIRQTKQNIKDLENKIKSFQLK